MVLFVLSITVERILKGGIHMSQTSPGIRQVLAQESWMETDIGYWVATKATEKAIEMAKRTELLL